MVKYPFNNSGSIIAVKWRLNNSGGRSRRTRRRKVFQKGGKEAEASRHADREGWVVTNRNYEIDKGQGRTGLARLIG